MLYCFKKGNSANDTLDKIYAGVVIIMTVRIRAVLKNERTSAQQRRIQILSRLYSLKIRDIVCVKYWISLTFSEQEYIIT